MRTTGHPSNPNLSSIRRDEIDYDRSRYSLFYSPNQKFFFFLSENREWMDTLSSQTTPIPAILPLPDVFLRSVHFLRRSFIHRYFLFNASDLHPFFFHHFSRYTFLLNEIIRPQTLFHTHASIVCGRPARRVYCNPKCSSRLLRQDERPPCTGCWPGPTTGEPW